MPEREDYWATYQRRRWLQNNHARFIRPDAARFFQPGADLSVLHARLAQKGVHKVEPFDVELAQLEHDHGDLRRMVEELRWELLRKYMRDAWRFQPRDEIGRWTTGGAAVVRVLSRPSEMPWGPFGEHSRQRLRPSQLCLAEITHASRQWRPSRGANSSRMARVERS